jgi:hypothetical protein
MKRAILILLLMAGIVFAQGFGKPRNIPYLSLPFVAGNDTLFRQDSLYSRVLDVGQFVGAISAGFQFKAVGDSCKAIDIYYQGRINDLNWGVPYDSLSVTYQDSNAYQQIHIAIVDSTTIKDQDAFWIPLSNLPWWSYHDEGRFIIKSPATIDTIYVKCRVRGQ